MANRDESNRVMGSIPTMSVPKGNHKLKDRYQIKKAFMIICSICGITSWLECQSSSNPSGRCELDALDSVHFFWETWVGRSVSSGQLNQF